MYNLTTLQNSETIVDIVLFANTITDDLLLSILMFAIFYIMISRLSKHDMDLNLLASSWACFILSTILAYSKLVIFLIPLAFLTIAGFTSIYVLMTRRRNA